MKEDIKKEVKQALLPFKPEVTAYQAVLEIIKKSKIISDID
jgi:hypothetical protein